MHCLLGVCRGEGEGAGEVSFTVLFSTTKFVCVPRMACWNLPSGGLGFSKFSPMHGYLPGKHAHFFLTTASAIWLGSLAALVLQPISRSVCLCLDAHVGVTPGSLHVWC